MNVKGKKILSEEEIDTIVVAQADDDSAWEKPIHMRKAKHTSLVLPSELAERAIFFACLHGEVSVEDWLRRVIQERIDMEEAAFAELKRDIAVKNNI